MAAPTRFPNGIGTRKQPDPMFMLGMPDPSDYHTYWNDFDLYVSGDWTATVTGTGTAALTAGDGGLLALATSNANNDNVFLQKTTEGFQIEAGKMAWFKTRLKVSALTSQIVIGLQVTDTTPLDVTDGIYFLTANTTGVASLICRKNATTGSTSAAAATLAADTWIELAWFYDGKDSLIWGVNGRQAGTITGVSGFLPDTTATISLGIQTTSAAVKTLTVDYILAAKER